MGLASSRLPRWVGESPHGDGARGTVEHWWLGWTGVAASFGELRVSNLLEVGCAGFVSRCPVRRLAVAAVSRAAPLSAVRGWVVFLLVVWFLRT